MLHIHSNSSVVQKMILRLWFKIKSWFAKGGPEFL